MQGKTRKRKQKLSAKATKERIVSLKQVLDNMPAKTQLNEATQEEIDNAVRDFINQPHLHVLTEKQRKLLYFMLCNLINPTLDMSNEELAERAGVSRSTVTASMLDPAFNAIYTLYVKESARFRHGTILNNLFDMSKTNVKAAEVYLKYADLLTERVTTKNYNVNANATISPQMTPEQNLGMLVETYRSAGYTLERLLNEITTIWNESSERF